jgi:hypothetical protein
LFTPSGLVSFGSFCLSSQQPYFTIQCALLYSTSYGERRIRVHTMQVRSSYVAIVISSLYFAAVTDNLRECMFQVPISAIQPDLFAAASVSAMTNLLAKQGLGVS